MTAQLVRRLVALAASSAVLIVAFALWVAAPAKAETFDVCPSGVTGVATPNTSCEFADNVRRAFYAQPGWTVYAYSPVTDKLYTLTCEHAVTNTAWWSPKRCFGINDVGAALVVYVA